MTPMDSRQREADPHMEVTLWLCGECELPAPAERWNRAWDDEYRKRSHDPEYADDEYGKDYGLDDRMVCPRCKYVHSDNENSYVDELLGVAIPVTPDESAASSTDREGGQR